MSDPNYERAFSPQNEVVASGVADKRPVSEALKFWGFYHAADVLWVGGALAGDMIAEQGVNRWVSALATAAVVTTAEYKLSDIAVETFERPEDIDKEMGVIRKVGSEIAATAYVAICGSSNAVKINDSLGIESTPRRRFAQATTFGTAVGLWVTSIPGFEDGREAVEDYIDDMVESPTNFLLYSAISVGGILAGSKVVKEVRKFFTRRHHTESEASL